MRKTGITERLRAKASQGLGDLTSVDVDSLCAAYEAATAAGEAWLTAINGMVDGDFPHKFADKRYAECFFVRQLIAWELTKRPEKKIGSPDAYRRMLALANWCEQVEGEDEQVLAALKATVAMICPHCGAVGHEANRSCCGGKVAA
jgi:hypothetical protein